MENWRIRNGQLQCTNAGSNRNVQLLTHTLSSVYGRFTTSVILEQLPEMVEKKKNFTLSEGASLNRNSAPNIVKRPLTITAHIDDLADGVIVAQGGTAVGYSLWVDDGKLIFTTRRSGTPKSVSTDKIQKNKVQIKAHLSEDGSVELRVDGQVKARGTMPGPIPKMPLDGLDVGRDSGTSVGTYSGETPFQGSINKVQIELGGTSSRAIGSAGFRVGINHDMKNYRGYVFNGDGIDATVSTTGQLTLAGKEKQLDGNLPRNKIQLTLTGVPDGRSVSLTLTVKNKQTGNTLGSITKNNVKNQDLVGNVGLTSNPQTAGRICFGYQNWTLNGPKVAHHPGRAFGPIMWTQYTLSDTGSNQGFVMKMAAQMPPLGQEDNRTVVLQVKRDGDWERIDTANIDPVARNAIFRVTNWNADRNVPYRVVYRTTGTNGETHRDTWRGTVRKNPDDEPVSVAGLNCQHGSGYPYGPVVRNVKQADPDVLFFAGDQLYEGNGGYGMARRPADRAMISYLRKFFMHGWVFRDLMRNRPTLCIPDDHDVFQGNIWGEGGAKLEQPQFGKGGYIEPVKTVNGIYRTQTGHHPGVQNLEPANRGISVFYGDMVYGRVSFGIVADRQFKTGAAGNPSSDLKLLGDRQLSFLRNWVADWEGADMKLLLSQTQWGDVNTHGGSYENRSKTNRDTGGWPPEKRDRAVRIARKGFAFHMNGDQHLPTLVHHGVDNQRDAFWGFCPPAVAVGFPRWFAPERYGQKLPDPPEHGLPNTGAYKDGFGNFMYVYAVGNPVSQHGANRYVRADNKSSGFGLVELNKQNRTIQVNAYRFFAKLSDPENDRQFAGWPVTVSQTSNYGKERIGTLGPYSIDGVEKPVVKVFDQSSNELVYALRSQNPSPEPFVFEEGRYTVKIGNPATDNWKTWENQKVNR